MYIYVYVCINRRLEYTYIYIYLYIPIYIYIGIYIYSCSVAKLYQTLCLFVTPWTAAWQASLSFSISQSFLKLMSIVSLMPPNHLILCCSLLLLPSIYISISFSLSLSIYRYIHEYAYNLYLFIYVYFLFPEYFETNLQM